MMRLLLWVFLFFGVFGLASSGVLAQGRKKASPPVSAPPQDPPFDTPSRVPEPATLVLAGAGCVALLSLARRKKGKKE
jgi:hypothetical protein